MFLHREKASRGLRVIVAFAAATRVPSKESCAGMRKEELRRRPFSLYSFYVLYKLYSKREWILPIFGAVAVSSQEILHTIRRARLGT